ncbi:DegT/DnrJ/EryC1/StrS family aminotransferase [Leucobacter sp. gxy201]|uniref:DegT/DnrJ/EryC1/StrS family aminotransferase n=1 Tax=Leucobacter sp. gxy201 TaxID=2957200 RepID=UPI003DA09660
MSALIPFIRPALPTAQVLSHDLERISEANWFSNFGPIEQAFRTEIADFIGDDELAVVTMNNATTGLMAALAGLLPRGDNTESIAVATFTFAAGAQAVIWHGYRPAWFDIDPVTLQPDLDSFNALHEKNPRIRAILLTQTFGVGAADIDAWEELASSHGIPLILDSAAGFGSEYPDGERLGSRGDCEVFSFHATKPFAIGEGGAVTTRDHTLAENLRSFTNFGFAAGVGAIAVGLNGKLQELNAAIGRHQLTDFEDTLTKRKAVLRQYSDEFATLPVSFPTNIERSSICFASMIVDHQASAPRVFASLQNASVEARAYYAPLLHRQPWLEQFPQMVSLEHSESIADRIVSLPVLTDMQPDEIRRVTAAVRDSF